jgi:LPXTG-motif cell wall-anchored protein
MPTEYSLGGNEGGVMKHVLRAVALFSLFLASLLIGLVGASPANAADSDTCEDIISGEGWDEKVEGDFNDGDPELTVTAPEGFLIDMYCVKTGSSNQGDGPVIVEVDPPAETVTIKHPTKEGVSHFIVHLIEAPSEPPTSETPTTETPGGPIVDNPPVVDNPEPQAPPALPATGAEETLWALGALGLALLMAGVSLVARRARS